MQGIIEAWQTPSIPVAGRDERFSVRRIFCVGRNYAAHAREMGRDPDREPPFFFTKFPDSVVDSGTTIAYPVSTANFHFEVELVVAIGCEGIHIPKDQGAGHLYGYAVGLDMTRRDLQLAARDQGRPWDSGKNFPESAPISALRLAEEVGHPRTGAISLDVDGDTKQAADISDMIWDTNEIVAHLSNLYRLLPGDLIMTGTPAGVGPVLPGQTITARIENLGELIIHVGPSED